MGKILGTAAGLVFCGLVAGTIKDDLDGHGVTLPAPAASPVHTVAAHIAAHTAASGADHTGMYAIVGGCTLLCIGFAAAIRAGRARVYDYDEEPDNVDAVIDDTVDDAAGRRYWSVIIRDAYGIEQWRGYIPHRGTDAKTVAYEVSETFQAKAGVRVRVAAAPATREAYEESRREPAGV